MIQHANNSNDDRYFVPESRVKQLLEQKATERKKAKRKGMDEGFAWAETADYYDLILMRDRFGPLYHNKEESLGHYPEYDTYKMLADPLLGEYWKHLFKKYPYIDDSFMNTIGADTVSGAFISGWHEGVIDYSEQVENHPLVKMFRAYNNMTRDRFNQWFEMSKGCFPALHPEYSYLKIDEYLELIERLSQR